MVGQEKQRKKEEKDKAGQGRQKISKSIYQSIYIHLKKTKKSTDVIQLG